MFFLFATDPPVLARPALDQSLQPGQAYQALPVILEGSVENFDPVARAQQLAKTMPRKWCGFYEPFANASKVAVILDFREVNAVGQMVALKGEMQLGNVKTLVQGNLNAKSDQLEILPLSTELIPGIESGGSFMGLEGIELSGWTSSSFANPGGKLVLNKSCADISSEPPVVDTIW